MTEVMMQGPPGEQLVHRGEHRQKYGCNMEPLCTPVKPKKPEGYESPCGCVWPDEAAYRRGSFAKIWSCALGEMTPLSLGGAPKSLNNLWPELRTGADGATVKDGFELKIHAAVCAGKVPLMEAQKAMAANWEAAYAKYFPGSAAK